jgi:hypothetical protein
MLPNYFYNYLNCVSKTTRAKCDGESGVTCEGYMLPLHIRALKKDLDCDVKEVTINGKNIYEVKLK